jgi:16S rRNA processing protein RimM
MPRRNDLSSVAGSGPSYGSEPQFLVIGQILAPFGIRGAVKVEVMTDFPDRFRGLRTVYLGDKHAPHEVRLAEVRESGRQAILQFKGFDNPEDAAVLRGQLIFIPIEDAIPLEEGQYYVHQVVGLTVQTDTGETLGVVADVLFTGGNDVYVVEKDGHEVLIPVVEDVILNVDLPAGTMLVRLPPGLID